MEKERQPIYPIDPWNITETSFNMADNYRNETTFALSNGYIGTRGTFEEAYDFSVDEGLEGNFINGFYESGDIRYGEWNFGFPLKSQSLLNLPDLKGVKLFVDGELFDMRHGLVKDYSRCLHLKDGVLTRKLLWTSKNGRKVRLETRRFVSFTDKNLMCLRYEVTPLNFDGEIKLLSTLDADVENYTRKTNPLVDYGPFGRRLEPDTLWGKDRSLYYQGHTMMSGLSMACGALHCLSGAGEPGYYEEAYHYFSQSARMDLDDYHDNFYAGIHGANMAGTWQAIVNGFAGLRTNDGKLRLNPFCPPQWEGYSFKISYQSSRLSVSIVPGKITVKLLKGQAAAIYIGDKGYTLLSEGDIIDETI